MAFARTTQPQTRTSEPPRQNPLQVPPRVVIVGGGIAGLVSAYELTRRGVSVHLFEMSDRLGGRIATTVYGPGLLSEYGMKEIWSGSPLARIAGEIGIPLDGGDDLFSSILLDGTLHVYARGSADSYLRSLLDPTEYSALQGWMQRSRSTLNTLVTAGLTPELERLNDLSFAGWLAEQQLPPRLINVIRLLLECEVGASADDFSAASGIAEFRVFLFGGERPLHVPGGNARLVEGLATQLGDIITLGARVIAVERSRDEAARLQAKLTFVRHEQVSTLTAERVILAVPWTTLHSMQLDPPLPREAWSALDTLGRGQYTVVHFLVDKRVEDLWGGPTGAPFPILTPGPLGVIYGTRASSSEQPLKVFALLIHGEKARSFHMLPQEREKHQLLQELDRMWPSFSSFVRGSNVYTYHPAAVPFWPPGRSPFDSRAQILWRDFDGLHLAGDYLVSSHSDGAVIAGLRQAELIANELVPTQSANDP